MNTTNNTLGSSALSKKDREDLDFYQTPAYATKTLAEKFDFKTKFIWEPMAGNGAISTELSKLGFKTYTTDIVQRSVQLNDVVDYFTIKRFGYSKGDFSIVTNPPYKTANKFLKYTLEVIKPRTCCVFLPIRYLEGKRRYAEIYSKYKPCKVLIYVSRLGCYTEKDVAEGKVTEYGVGSAVAYMWLCFDRDTWSKPDAKTEIEWVS